MEAAAAAIKKEDDGEDVLVRRYNLLKRKCKEYEEMNGNLLARTKKIRSVIEETEREKSFLIKRLEQFEVLDEIPKSRFSLNPETLPEVENEKALLVTAVRIRAEVNEELARLKSQNNHPEHVPNNAHHTTSVAGSVSPVSSIALPHTHAMTTPLQSPVASVIVTPSSLVPASVPSTGRALTKVKKTKPTKGAGRGSGAVKRKKPDADPNAPKKPSNAFFWFCQEKRAPLQEQFRGEGMSGQHDLTKALARLWSETATEDKKKYYHKYTADKARYDKEMKEYTSMMKQGTMDADSSNDSLKVEPLT